MQDYYRDITFGLYEGRTFHNSYIVADEMQNASVNQMKMLLTRIGKHSKLAVTGDLHQTDRPRDNGLSGFIHKLVWTSSKYIAHCKLCQKGCVRTQSSPGSTGYLGWLIYRIVTFLRIVGNQKELTDTTYLTF